MSRGLTPRTLQGMQTKQKIFEAAMSMFQNKGYDNVSIDDIVNSCNVSKGSFYHHFKSKKDVIIQHYSEEVGKLTDSYTMDPDYEASKTKCIIDLLNHLLYLCIKFGLDCSRQVLMGYLDESVALDKEDPAFKLIEKLMKEGISKGEFNKDTDIYRAIDSLNSINFGSLCMWISSRGEIDALGISKDRISAFLDEIKS